ncbi:Zot domain-containing protein [Vibrio aestuarianus]|uniref:zonular occludens toxin domain-containing protein n=1 Tax=Vibrio aestuarianus TaxID=28171 RepID=UPI00145603A1|nr:zonular occludens toxin domain-containing protein [Vibrio aestuarianus]NLS63622.1 assembly protein [Vibrio aestuarianus subsp. francensis]CAH8189026.1 Zot domain-containing protein [Vibrio aestuarianus]
MAVYFVTGKLGAGKSLTAVGRIRDAFERGAPVATNLDINLRFMLGRNKKKTRLYRVPDKPNLHDLQIIGKGNDSYDERKNGLLVLDECGTWFNSRTWNDKSRQDVINWFLHARKLGWDIIFIVQDISIVDKQARLALAEHTVFCRRLDRMQIPIISALIRILSFGQLRIPLPKLHLGIVKYGDNVNSITVDKWYLWGTDLYSSYDTKQAFSDHYQHSTYSVLPPWYTHGRYTVKYTLRNIMRITKIYYRKYSRISMFILGSLLSFSILQLFSSEPDTQVIQQIESDIKPENFDLSGYKIVSYMRAPNAPLYFELDKSGQRITSVQLESKGYTFISDSRCNITVRQGGKNEKLHC